MKGVVEAIERLEVDVAPGKRTNGRELRLNLAPEVGRLVPLFKQLLLRHAEHRTKDSAVEVCPKQSMAELRPTPTRIVMHVFASSEVASSLVRNMSTREYISCKAESPLRIMSKLRRSIYCT
jgi:hypothetical protein